MQQSQQLERAKTKSKKIVLLLLTFVLLLSVLAALTACGTNEETTYAVYFGLIDADTGTQKATVEDAAPQIRKIITDKGMGYTEFVTYGAYVEDGVIYGNDTLIYTLTFTDKDTVLAIVAEARAKLNLASVMIETSVSSYEFVGEGEKK